MEKRNRAFSIALLVILLAAVVMPSAASAGQCPPWAPRGYQCITCTYYASECGGVTCYADPLPACQNFTPIPATPAPEEQPREVYCKLYATIPWNFVYSESVAIYRASLNTDACPDLPRRVVGGWKVDRYKPVSAWEYYSD